MDDTFSAGDERVMPNRASDPGRMSRYQGHVLAAMNDNVLIPLTGFHLPGDFPWRVGFVTLVDLQLRRLRATGHFLPPRFFGYFFRGDMPFAVGGSWTVSLDAVPPVTLLPESLEKYTLGKYEIVSASREFLPEYMLVQDTRDGACWLWSFAHGAKFVEAVEPVMAGETGMDDVEKTRLLGP
jgi:hypothetical protein